MQKMQPAPIGAKTSKSNAGEPQNKPAKQSTATTPIIISVSGGIVSVVAAALLANAAAGGASGANGTSAFLQPVAATQITAALQSIEASQRDAVAAKAKSCELPLVSVTIQGVPSNGTVPSGTVQIRAGTYLSPVFTITETPFSVALPYPAPVSALKGQIEFLGQATVFRASFGEPQFYPLLTGSIVQPVYWDPVTTCQPAQG